MSEPAHILVVDDDRETRTLFCDYLERNGFRATAVGGGPETRRALARSCFDLIVLDLMLPHESGLAICRELRSSPEVPIIMVTALADEVERAVGVDLDADARAAQPFSPRELLARIRAVLRRSLPRAAEPATVRAYRFAGWRLDMTARMLTSPADRDIPLGGAEFRLLATLLAHAPRVVSRAQLMELVRGSELDPFDRSIDAGVGRLRRTLGDDARAPGILRTVHGEGYIVAVAVEREGA